MATSGKMAPTLSRSRKLADPLGLAEDFRLTGVPTIVTIEMLIGTM